MKLPRRSPIRSSIPNISNLSDIFKDLFLENSCVNFRPKAKFRKFSAGLYEKSSPFFSLRDIMIFIVFISKLLEFGSCMQTQHTKEKKKTFSEATTTATFEKRAQYNALFSPLHSIAEERM